MNSPRPTGLASSGKIVRLSRSAGICRAAVVMAMTSEESQINSRQSSLRKRTMLSSWKKFIEAISRVMTTTRASRT